MRFSFQEVEVSQVEANRLPYKVKDLSLADLGRKEIMLAELQACMLFSR